MSTKPIRMPVSLRDKDTFGFFEDWESNYVTGDRWTPLTADSSSAATLVLVLATAGIGGVLSVTQDATDNDEIYFGMTKNPFKIAANKPCYYETRMQYSELATSANNVILGWGSAATYAANGLIDDGGGPVATATMAVIYKVDGGTVWRCRSQIGAAVGQTDTVSEQTAGGSAYQALSVEVLPYSSTNAKVIYKMDGQPLTASVGGRSVPIVHDLVYTNAIAMSPIWGGKTGGANAEVILNDYIAAYQAR
jgi:hypothetical protein